MIDAAAAGDFTLILPDDLISELCETISEKRHLARAISLADVETVLDVLRARAEHLPSVPVPQSRITRDPEDDYLLAAAAIADADVLVSGDQYWLAVRDLLQKPAILTPGEFLHLLDALASGQP
jgi:predicted nucleic acid-binding protein